MFLDKLKAKTITEEDKLLKEYKKLQGKNTSDEYYAALSLVEYYYKLRDDEKSLAKCVDYCNKCILLLDVPQMKEYISEGIRIPAFRHLITINEKNKNYLAAYNLCLNAIEHSQNRTDELEYYKGKAEKLKSKLN